MLNLKEIERFINGVPGVSKSFEVKDLVTRLRDAVKAIKLTESMGYRTKEQQALCVKVLSEVKDD